MEEWELSPCPSPAGLSSAALPRDEPTLLWLQERPRSKHAAEQGSLGSWLAFLTPWGLAGAGMLERMAAGAE